MRLATVCAFLGTFAAATWLMRTPVTADRDLAPATPVATAGSAQMRNAEPAPAPLAPEEVACLNWCANDTNAPLAARREALHRLFACGLQPPADAARVRSILTDAAWVSRASVSEFASLAGWSPIPTSRPGREVFWVFATTDEGDVLARFMVRVSGLPGATPADLVAFFRGAEGRSGALRVEEFCWLRLDEPPPGRRVEHHTPGRVIYYQ